MPSSSAAGAGANSGGPDTTGQSRADGQPHSGAAASRDTWADRLADAIERTGSVACVGMDPRTESLPPALRPSSPGDWAAVAASYETFCCGIIDAVVDLVPVVKPQTAFFEQLGPAGMATLHRIIQHASACGLLTILDGKRNDIGSTAEAYAAAYLGRKSPWGCDSLTVSPYLGDDSLDPFVAACDKTASGIFVLVKTSNPGGGFLQDQLVDGQPIYSRIARWVTQVNGSRKGASGYGPVGAVVGATYPEQLAALRQEMPTAMILVPGYGAQGGGAADVADGFDSRGGGAIVNSSRHILFAYQRPEFRGSFGPQKWQDAARAATIEMNHQLNAVRSTPAERQA